MAYEKLVRRVIYEAKCPCGEWEDTVTDRPPREAQCPKCRTWNKYELVEWTGTDFERR